MNMIFLPPAGSKLRKMWPNGTRCEIAEFAGANVHIRVPFENHTAKHPHTARIITTYNRLQWQD